MSQPGLSQTELSRPAALPAEWARLHPLSPIVRAGRAAVGLGAVFGIRGAATHESPWDALIVFGVAAVAAFVYWRVTKWRVHGGELQIDTGLIRRQQVRVPLSRIQGIDLVRPLAARVLGVSEVRLVLAGHGTKSARLAYLSEDKAVLVRAQLLAVAHGLDDQTPEPPERPILAVHGGRLIASYLLTARVVVCIVCLSRRPSSCSSQPQTIGPGIGAMVALIGSALLATGRQISAEWELQVAESPDGLRLRGGLLQTRAETVPHGRVQAVRWIEPLLWRPLGWVRLEFDVARRRNADRGENQSGATSKALLPVGTRDEARWLLSRVLPGAVAELPPAEGVPRRALWRVPLGRRFARLGYDGDLHRLLHRSLPPRHCRRPAGEGAEHSLVTRAVVETAAARQRFHRHCRPSIHRERTVPRRGRSADE